METDVLSSAGKNDFHNSKRQRGICVEKRVLFDPSLTYRVVICHACDKVAIVLRHIKSTPLGTRPTEGSKIAANHMDCQAPEWPALRDGGWNRIQSHNDFWGGQRRALGRFAVLHRRSYNSPAFVGVSSASSHSSSRISLSSASSPKSSTNSSSSSCRSSDS